MKISKELIQQEFSIEGLSCTSCANSAQRRLNNIIGVVSAVVNFDTKTADIQYNIEQTSPQEFKTALDELGYDLVTES